MAKGNSLQDWQAIVGDPSSPTGLTQKAEQAVEAHPGPDATNQQLQFWQGVYDSAADSSKDWLTGGNTESANNGWGTLFQEKYYTGWTQAVEQGKAASYFTDPANKATGVVMWDHTDEDGKQFTFGDIYEDGEFKGNVYELNDRATADLKMSWWLGNEAQSRITRAADPLEEAQIEVSKYRRLSEKEFADSLQAAAFQEGVEGVEGRTEEVEKGWGDELGVFAAGALGGAAVVGGVLLTATGVGAGPGIATTAGGLSLLGGAVVGGGAALANQDELTEQYARMLEIVEASKGQDLGTRASTVLGQAAQLTGSYLSPLKNINRGVAEVVTGGVGDNTSAFYKKDEQGNDVTPRWLKVTDVAATLGDSLLQFASPAGRVSYFTQMGAATTGKVGEQVFGGQVFDYHTGGFVDVDDYSGGRLAALGSIAIDVVQMGMAKGLIDSARGTVATARTDVQAGIKYTFDDAGKVVSRRPTVQLLAPSEAINALGARGYAMKLRGGIGPDGIAPKVTADDIYAAAKKLSTGDARWTNTLLTSMGEGAEEFVQTLLDQKSVGARMDLGEALSAGYYGAAAGAGMAVGTNLMRPEPLDQRMAEASLVAAIREGSDFDETQWEARWRKMSTAERESYLPGDVLEQALVDYAKQVTEYRLQTHATAGLVEASKVMDAARAEKEVALKRAQPDRNLRARVTSMTAPSQLNRDGSVQFGSYAVASNVMSAQLMLSRIRNQVNGLQEALAAETRNLNTAMQLLAENPNDENAKRAAEVAEGKVTSLQRQVSHAGTVLREYTDNLVDLQRAKEDGDFAAVETLAHRFNEILRADARMVPGNRGLDQIEDLEAVSRLAITLTGRNPFLHGGSIQLLIPQVSPHLTILDAGPVVQTTPGIATQTNQDYDGDTVFVDQMLQIASSTWRNQLSGSTYVSTGEQGIEVMAPDNLGAMVTQLSAASRSDEYGGLLALRASQAIDEMVDTIRNRYQGKVSQDLVLMRTLRNAADAMREGDKSALWDAFFKGEFPAVYASELIEGTFAADGGTDNEWLWIANVVLGALDRFSSDYSQHFSGSLDMDTTPKTAATLSPLQLQRAERYAATVGATAAMQLTGGYSIRTPQILHYNVGTRESVVEAEEFNVSELESWFASINSGLTETALDTARGESNLQLRVVERLDALVRDAVKAAELVGDRVTLGATRLQIAMLPVRDVIDGAGEWSYQEQTIPLIQLLFKHEVSRQYNQNQATIEANEDLKLRFDTWFRMFDASEENRWAVVQEVLGAHQVEDLIGDRVGPVPSQLTLNQLVEMIASRSLEQRSKLTYRLKTTEDYRRPDNQDRLPTIAEVEAGEYSPYAFLVDAALYLGNHVIALDANGKPVGKRAQQSERTSTALQETLKNVQRAWSQFRNANPGADVSEFINSTTWGRAYLDLLPNWVVRSSSMGNRLPEFLYDMLEMKDPVKAEAHYFKNLRMAEWRGAVHNLSELDDPIVDKTPATQAPQRQREKLPTQLHQIMFDLAMDARRGNVAPYMSFMEKLESMTNVDKFIEWVNTTPWVLGDRAPITAWSDYLADVDSNAGQGARSSGSALRETITKLRTATRSIEAQQTTVQQRIADDKPMLDSLSRAWEQTTTGRQVATPRDLRNLADFTELLRRNLTARTPAGSNALLQYLDGVVQGVNAQAQEKGKPTAHTAPQGALDIFRKLLGYESVPEVTLQSLTTYGTNITRSSLLQIMREGGRFTDLNGEVIEDATETEVIGQLIEMLKDEGMRPFAESLVLPTVLDVNMAGNAEVQLATGASLTDLLTKSAYAELFAPAVSNEGYGSDTYDLELTRATQYLRELESRMGEEHGNLPITAHLAKMVTAWTYASKTTVTAEVQAQLVARAVKGLARTLQGIGAVEPSALPELRDIVRKSLKTAAKQRRFFKKSEVRSIQAAGADVEQLIDTAIEGLRENWLEPLITRAGDLDARRAELKQALAGATTAAEKAPIQDAITALEAEGESIQVQREQQEALIQALREGELIQQLSLLYSLTGDPARDVEAKRRILHFIRRHRAILRPRYDSVDALTQAINAIQSGPTAIDALVLDDSVWAELSNVVLTHAISVNTTEQRLGIATGLYPEEAEWQKLYDTSFGYLSDPLLDNTGIAAVARQLNQDAQRGTTTRVVSTPDLAKMISKNIYPEDLQAAWTPAVAEATKYQIDQLNVAAGPAAISAFGATDDRMAATAAAQERTFQIPGLEWTSSVSLVPADLADGTSSKLTSKQNGGANRIHPLRIRVDQLNGRFASRIVARLSDGTELDWYSNFHSTGWKPRGAENAPYCVLDLPRLQAMVDARNDEGRTLGVSVAAVDIDFLHPDDHALSGVGTHNVFFEGLTTSTDDHPSAEAALWAATGSWIPVGMQLALDSSKGGGSSIENVLRMTREDRQNLPDPLVDLSSYLWAKALWWHDNDPIGTGRVNLLNAYFPALKQRHALVGWDESGQVHVLHPHEVIRQQVAHDESQNPNDLVFTSAGAPLTDVYIWEIPPDVLTTVAGEQGKFGQDYRVDRAAQTRAEIRLTPQLTEDMSVFVEKFGHTLQRPGEQKKLKDSAWAALPPLQVNRLRPRDGIRADTPGQVRARVHVINDEIMEARFRKQADNAQYFASLTEASRENFNAAKAEIDESSILFGESMPGMPEAAVAEKESTAQMQSFMQNVQTRERADQIQFVWEYGFGPSAQNTPSKGLISKKHFGSAKPAAAHGELEVAAADLVIVRVDDIDPDNFPGGELQAIADTGATVILHASTQREMRGIVAAAFGELGYTNLNGSFVLRAPVETSTTMQERAALSTLTAAVEFDHVNPQLILVNPRQFAGDGTMLVTEYGRENVTYSDTQNAFNTERYARFNMPTPSQIPLVRDILETWLADETAVNELRKVAVAKQKGKEARATAEKVFNRSVETLRATLAKNDRLLPDELRVGDFVVLFDGHDRIILDGWGMKAAKPNDIAEQFDKLIGSEVGKVAVTPLATDETATARDGRVFAVRERVPHGITVELLVDNRDLSARVLLQDTTLKMSQAPYVPGESAIRIPEGKVFSNGMSIAGAVQQKDVKGKLATAALLADFQMLFALGGVDFRPYIMRALTPGAQDPQRAIDILKGVAANIRRTASQAGARRRMSLADTQELLELVDSALPTLENVDSTGLTDRLAVENDADAAITRILLAYLLEPGSRIEWALGTGGLAAANAGGASKPLLMPALITDAIFSLPAVNGGPHPLQKQLIDDFNALIDRTTPGQKIILNYDFTVDTEVDGFVERGQHLLFNGLVRGDDPLSAATTSPLDDQRQPMPPHNANISYLALGAEQILERAPREDDLFDSDNGILRFTEDTSRLRVLQMGTDIDASKQAGPPKMRRRTAAEHRWMRNAEKMMKRYYGALGPKNLETYWTEEQAARYEARITGPDGILEKFGLDVTKHRDIVDHWVRIILDRPTATLEGKDVGYITGDDALNALDAIESNYRAGRFPTYGNGVAAFPLEHLRLLFLANRGRADNKRWAPKLGNGKQAGTATSWEDTLRTVLGQMLSQDLAFDRVRLLAFDGFMHTYLDTFDDLEALPTSIEVLSNTQVQLARVRAGEIDFDTSISQLQQRLNASQEAIDLQETDLDQLIGGERRMGLRVNDQRQDSVAQQTRRRLNKYKRDNGMHIYEPVSIKDYRKQVADVIEVEKVTSGFMEGLVSLSAIMRLANPYLISATVVDLSIRETIDTITKTLTGQKALGLGGRVGIALSDFARREQTGPLRAGIANLLRATGWRTTLNQDQVKQFKQLSTGLGRSGGPLAGELKKDLFTLQPTFKARGSLSHKLSRGARTVASWQDALKTSTGPRMISDYLEVALSYISVDPNTEVSVQTVMDNLVKDELYIKRNHPDAHMAALKAVAQVRSLKVTPLGKGISGAVDLLIDKGGLWAVPGYVLRFPLLFAGYNSGAITTMTGMQGISDMVATALHGRKNWFTGKTIDMSDVIEDFDLTRSFAAGAVTQTMLLHAAVGMQALGFFGEDEEERRRRRLEEAQGVPHIEFIEIENDFRNQDALFLSDVPILGGLWRVVKGDDMGGPVSMIHPTWIMDQYLAPARGIARFANSGDTADIKNGFVDGLLAMPLFNLSTFNDTLATVNEMEALAADEKALGGGNNATQTYGWLTNMVGMYENMLLENSFVNQIYQASTEYLVDPYVMPAMDEYGNVIRDAEGDVMPTGARESYLSDTGQWSQGRANRDVGDGQMHALTSSRFGLAVLKSVFSGSFLGSDYLRGNMPAKVINKDKEPMTEEYAEAIAIAATLGANLLSGKGEKQPLVSQDEIRYALIDMNAKQGVYQDDATLQAKAKVIAEQMNNAEMTSLMTEYNELEGEFLNDAGALAVLRGLVKGTLTLDSPVIKTLYIDPEMRARVAEAWMKEELEKGLSLGLPQYVAEKRVSRLWYGPKDDPTVMGVEDMLYSKKIPITSTLKYKQLNTTFAKGPDGKMWATGISRNALLGFFGFQTYHVSQQDGSERMGTDQLLNSTDLMANINTGERGLVPLLEEDFDLETPEFESLLKKAADDVKKGGGGYSRRGGYGGGGGGHYAITPRVYFNRLQWDDHRQTPYALTTRFVNADNPILRRANIRRERVSSERGRLKPWQ